MLQTNQHVCSLVTRWFMKWIGVYGINKLWSKGSKRSLEFNGSGRFARLKYCSATTDARQDIHTTKLIKVIDLKTTGSSLARDPKHRCYHGKSRHSYCHFQKLGWVLRVFSRYQKGDLMVTWTTRMMKNSAVSFENGSRTSMVTPGIRPGPSFLTSNWCRTVMVSVGLYSRSFSLANLKL